MPDFLVAVEAESKMPNVPARISEGKVRAFHRTVVAGCLLGLLSWVSWGAEKAAPASRPTAVPSARSAPSARISAAPTKAGEVKPAEQKKISVDFRDTPVADAIRTVADAVGANVVIESGVTGTVNLRLTNVEWGKILDEIVNQAGAVLKIEAENLFRVSKPPRITLNAVDADLTSLVDLIALQSGVNIVVAPEVRAAGKKVTLRIKDVPWDKALELVVQSCGFVVVEEPEYRVRRVVKQEMLEEQLQTRVFPLKYVQPPPPYQAKIDTQVTTKQKEETPQFTLFNAVKNIVSKNGKIQFDMGSNSIVVTDTLPKLQEIEAVIALMDVEPKQIYIDVKFVTTENQDLVDLGTDWTAGGAVVPRMQLTGGKTQTRFPFHLFRGPSVIDRLYVAQDAKGSGFRPGPSPKDIEPATFTLGTLDFSALQMVMRFIEQDTRTQIQQAPSLLTLDNHPATIFVGKTIRFAETSTEAVEGTTTQSIKEASGSPVQTGFQLLIVPHIVTGTDQIILTVVPKFEELAGPDADGFQTFTSGNQQIRLPQVRSTTVITRLKLDNTETAVIGGLWDDRNASKRFQIPFLGDIPVLNFFFKNRARETRRSSLLIFITVNIVDRAQESRKVKAEELAYKRDIFTSEKPSELREKLQVRKRELYTEAPSQRGTGFMTTKFTRYHLEHEPE